MTENQKLREAFETYITDDGKWPNAILKAPGGQYLLLRTSVAWQDWKACAEALALLTVPAISDTWGISRALVTLYAYECDGATDKALALITADHIPDAGEKVADHLPDATKMIEAAAPVGERELFERTMMDKYGWQNEDFKLDDFGYFDGQTDTAWMAWQARAAMSAGDAVDAQRYRWLADCNNYEAGLALIIDPKLTEQALDAAIDAAMRKDKP